MILIFTHKGDYSSKRVCEWLHYFDKDFYRFNEDGVIKLRSVKIDCNGENEWIFELPNGKSILSKEVLHTYFRAGSIQVDDSFMGFQRNGIKERNFEDEYASYITNYSVGKTEFVIHHLNTGRAIGLNGLGRYNKLLALDVAVKSGLTIPDTLVTTSKKELTDFKAKHGSIITKSLDIGFNIYDDEWDGMFQLYTSEISNDFIRGIPEHFSLSLFQQKIEKAYEIRTFYLRGKCYSSAIFSQQDEKTKVDFRRIDESTFNRIVPFKLPDNVETQIVKFMNGSRLDTGSLDFIKSQSGEFIFLEVNPVGQFGYTSDLCNYYLHKKLAEELMK